MYNIVSFQKMTVLTLQWYCSHGWGFSSELGNFASEILFHNREAAPIHSKNQALLERQLHM